MPLSFSIKPRTPIITKVKNVVNQSLVYIRPEIILGVFLIVAILLAFLKISAIGFYIVFGIFITCYFAERITLILHRKYAKE